jgi:GR25 family glycosyltransferase involved in LPS biosynthesis
MDQIPFIACINLKSRPDRLHHSKEQFKRANINNIYYHIVDKSPNGGRYGCYESHLAVYKKALQQGHKYALVFEDDFIINVDDVGLALSRAFRCMRIDRKWSIIKLQGTGVIDVVEHIDDGIFRGNVLNTRCYLISKRAMNLFVKQGITCNHIDVEQTVQLKNKLFYVKPSIIRDAPFTSDNHQDNAVIQFTTEHRHHIPQLDRVFSDICQEYALISKLNRFMVFHLIYRKPI